MHSSNDGGGAYEGRKRQTGMSEAGVGSDYRWAIASGKTDAASGVPVWRMEAVEG